MAIACASSRPPLPDRGPRRAQPLHRGRQARDLCRRRQRAAPSRPGAHDLTYEDGNWSYRDSYFGGTDFIGQEVVWLDGEPVWAMSYYGYVLRPELIDATRAGATIKAALSEMYAEGRFLGGFSWTGEHGTYVDSSVGNAAHFRGREYIEVGGAEAYALDYFGGLIKP